MVMFILLLNVFLAAVSGNQDGPAAQTHPPVVAPDSESIIVARSHGETHHSDVYLTKSKNLTEQVAVTIAPPTIDAAEIHHGDAHMMKGVADRITAKPEVSTMRSTSTFSTASTAASRVPNDNAGSHPVAPVHHTNHNRKIEDTISKSIVDHFASFVEGLKSDKSERNQPSIVEKPGSVVAHGPMVKHADNYERKFEKLKKNEAIHSTIQHAPMATEHHPPKPAVLHPSLSKNVPISSGHAPMLSHPVVEEKTTTEQPREQTVKDENSEPHVSPHAPTAIDPESKHLVDLLNAPQEQIHVEKRSEIIDKDSTTPRIIEIHHPLLSKTEAALPVGYKANQDDVNDDQKTDVTTTENTNNP